MSKDLSMKTKLFFALTLITLSSIANAAELASNDELISAITGNTVQGSMQASGVYTEYYADGGVVYGLDYTAKWSVEGNSMCWVYEGSPKDCWNAIVTADQINWIKNGKSLGTGTILEGNPNNF